MTVNKVEFNFPRLGSLTCLAVYNKGKKDLGISSKRILVENSNNKQMLLWFDPNSSLLGGFKTRDVQVITNSPQFKSGIYNYYLTTLDPLTVLKQMEQEAIKADILVPQTINSFHHINLSQVNYNLITY